MNTPTKEQRDKIDQAIDTVTSICSSGKISPSKAIAKVASDMKLTTDYLPIIVRAYNTGAATIHREDSHTPQEKAASYPIAYLDEVVSLLQKSFPLNKKASVEKPRDTFWEYNANYHFPNAWDHLVEIPEPSMWDVKQASVKRCTVAKDNAQKNVNSTAKRTADEATRIKYAAEEEKDKAVAEVERVLCQNSGIKLATAKEYAAASYGTEGLNIINKLIKANRLEKTAQYRVETYIPFDHPFAKAFENLVLKNEEFKKAAAAEQKILKQCVGVINSYVRPKDRYMDNDESIDAMFKEGEMKRRKKDLKSQYQKKNSALLKEAYRPLSESGVGGITGLEQLNHPGWVGLDRFERELMYGLADPAHEAKLRNIRVQTILTDLMNTDPYLKDKDPEEVIDALNDIMEINPDLHKNKPMLRIALRQFLESGGMDIPTLGVLSEFGKEERERQSRERSQAESAAQQFASQQESARQADEKLRSEELRAKEDRESKERITRAELDARAEQNQLQREHEMAIERLRHPEKEKKEETSAAQQAGEYVGNWLETLTMLRHPLKAIEAYSQGKSVRGLLNKEKKEEEKREEFVRGVENEIDQKEDDILVEQIAADEQRKAEEERLNAETEEFNKKREEAIVNEALRNTASAQQNIEDKRQLGPTEARRQRRKEDAKSKQDQKTRREIVAQQVLAENQRVFYDNGLLDPDLEALRRVNPGMATHLEQEINRRSKTSFADRDKKEEIRQRMEQKVLDNTHALLSEILPEDAISAILSPDHPSIKREVAAETERQFNQFVRQREEKKTQQNRKEQIRETIPNLPGVHLTREEFIQYKKDHPEQFRTHEENAAVDSQKAQRVLDSTLHDLDDFDDVRSIPLPSEAEAQQYQESIKQRKQKKPKKSTGTAATTNLTGAYTSINTSSNTDLNNWFTSTDTGAGNYNYDYNNVDNEINNSPEDEELKRQQQQQAEELRRQQEKIRQQQQQRAEELRRQQEERAKEVERKRLEYEKQKEERRRNYEKYKAEQEAARTVVYNRRTTLQNSLGTLAKGSDEYYGTQSDIDNIDYMEGQDKKKNRPVDYIGILHSLDGLPTGVPSHYQEIGRNKRIGYLKRLDQNNNNGNS